MSSSVKSVGKRRRMFKSKSCTASVNNRTMRASKWGCNEIMYRRTLKMVAGILVVHCDPINSYEVSENGCKARKISILHFAGLFNHWKLFFANHFDH